MCLPDAVLLGWPLVRLDPLVRLGPLARLGSHALNPAQKICTENLREKDF